jgi:hypothetical protein
LSSASALISGAFSDVTVAVVAASEATEVDEGVAATVDAAGRLSAEVAMVGSRRAIFAGGSVIKSSAMIVVWIADRVISGPEILQCLFNR